MAKFKHNGVKISNRIDRNSIEKNTDSVLLQIKDYILNHINGKQANKLLYWLNDWSAYILPNEKTFSYDSLIKYEQYSLFEANFGFKVGSEAGGLHHGFIIDKDNAKSSKIVMVIPFKSLDEGKTEDDIDKKTEVYLGNKVFMVQIERYKAEIKKIDNRL